MQLFRKIGQGETCDCVVTHASSFCILFVQKLGAGGVAVGEVVL